MKWILLAMMTASTANGPTHPVFMTAEFGDRAACEQGAKNLVNLTQRWRVRDLDWGCSPYSITPDSAPR